MEVGRMDKKVIWVMGDLKYCLSFSILISPVHTDIHLNGNSLIKLMPRYSMVKQSIILKAIQLAKRISNSSCFTSEQKEGRNSDSSKNDFFTYSDIKVIAFILN